MTDSNPAQAWFVDQQFTYGVWVNGAKVTGRPLLFDEASGTAQLWRSKGFQDVIVDVLERDSSER